MKDDVRNRSAEQLNQTSAQPEQTSFSLDDIVREFGGWTQREDETPEQEPVQKITQQPDVEPEPEMQEEPAQVMMEEAAAEITEEPQEVLPEPEPQPQRQSRFTFIHLDLSAQKEEPIDPLEREWDRLNSAEEEPIRPEHPEVSPKQQETAAVELKVLPKPEKKRRKTDPALKSDLPPVSNQETYNKAKKRLQRSTIFTLSSLLPLLSSMFVTFWLHFDWPLSFAKPQGMQCNLLLLVMLALSALLAYEVLLDGVRALPARKFRMETSLLACLLAVLIDALTIMDGSRIPMAAPVCLALFIALVGRCLRHRALCSSLKVVFDAKDMQAVVCKQAFWHENDCLTRQHSEMDRAAEYLLEPDGCEKAMRIYAPVSAALSVVLASVISALTNTSYFQILSVLLIGSMPLIGFLAYTLPWNLVSSKLRKSGAAIFGWQGAKAMSGQKHLVLRGNDLFPTANVSFNGLKICGDHRITQVVSYAGTVITASECELVPLFQNLMEEYGAHSYLIGSFRRYEGGGFGAEIAGDVVLTGSQRFMQLMGIKIPTELSSVKQALYLSINGELAGVFALSYKASAAVRTSLATLQRSKTLTLLLAARDFLISPQMLAKRYHITSDYMEFPAVADRFALSQTEEEIDGSVTAALSRSSFSAYSGAVLGGRSLYSVTCWGTVLSFISGVLGLALMLLLTRVGAADTASAANLTQYMLLWLIPSVLLGLWVRK